jgi:hypothetical protein
MARGRPNRQYNTAKQETREAEALEREQDMDLDIDEDETMDVCDLMGSTMFDEEEWE